MGRKSAREEPINSFLSSNLGGEEVLAGVAVGRGEAHQDRVISLVCATPRLVESTNGQHAN